VLVDVHAARHQPEESSHHDGAGRAVPFAVEKPGRPVAGSCFRDCGGIPGLKNRRTLRSDAHFLACFSKDK